MPFFVCKASTHYTRTNEGTCQTTANHENLAMIARQDGLLQDRSKINPAAGRSLSACAAAAATGP